MYIQVGFHILKSYALQLFALLIYKLKPESYDSTKFNLDYVSFESSNDAHHPECCLTYQIPRFPLSRK